MSWKAREYFDTEARKKLMDAIPDASLHEEVERAYNDGIAAIERAEVSMHDAYSKVPRILAQVSSISETSQEDLIVICRRIAMNLPGLEWYQVLDIVQSFYRVRESLSTEKKSE